MIGVTSGHRVILDHIRVIKEVIVVTKGTITVETTKIEEMTGEMTEEITEIEGMKETTAIEITEEMKGRDMTATETEVITGTGGMIGGIIEGMKEEMIATRITGGTTEREGMKEDTTAPEITEEMKRRDMIVKETEVITGTGGMKGEMTGEMKEEMTEETGTDLMIEKTKDEGKTTREEEVNTHLAGARAEALVGVEERAPVPNLHRAAQALSTKESMLLFITFFCE